MTSIPQRGPAQIVHHLGMTTYQGPATVMAADTEYAVTADLEIINHGDIREWTGTITAEGEAAAWQIFNDNDTRLRIADRTGGFVSSTLNADTAELNIQGAGPAPYGA